MSEVNLYFEHDSQLLLIKKYLEVERDSNKNNEFLIFYSYIEEISKKFVIM